MKQYMLTVSYSHGPVESKTVAAKNPEDAANKGKAMVRSNERAYAGIRADIHVYELTLVNAISYSHNMRF